MICVKPIGNGKGGIQMATKNKLSLVILAAGMGSRFGGLKQIEKITDNGSVILDFSISDAIKAGFTDVVFIIREDIKKDFIDIVGSKVEKLIPTRYAMQDMTVLPKGRTKPFGTAHALYCVKDIVKNPFAVINADDFYGENSFKKIAQFFKKNNQDWAMVSYELGKTLSKHGTVARGICEVEKCFLKSVTEITKINPDGSYTYNGKEISPNHKTPVSMSFWGFRPNIFPFLEEKFYDFLKNNDLQKDEFLLPEVVNIAIKTGYQKLKVLTSSDEWFGVTYRDDLAVVKEKVNNLKKKGKYKNL